MDDFRGRTLRRRIANQSPMKGGCWSLQPCICRGLSDASSCRISGGAVSGRIYNCPIASIRWIRSWLRRLGPPRHGREGVDRAHCLPAYGQDRRAVSGAVVVGDGCIHAGLTLARPPPYRLQRAAPHRVSASWLLIFKINVSLRHCPSRKACEKINGPLSFWQSEHCREATRAMLA
jgi:hypothetical protein